MKNLKNLILLCFVSLIAGAAVNAQTAKVKEIDAKEFDALSKKPNVMILDVRTPEEVAEGKIKGAKNIDFMDNEFMSKVDSLDKNITYLIYCKAGGRSAKAAAALNSVGFKSTYSLDDGITGWQEEGKPIEK